MIKTLRAPQRGPGVFRPRMNCIWKIFGNFLRGNCSRRKASGQSYDLSRRPYSLMNPPNIAARWPSPRPWYPRSELLGRHGTGLRRGRANVRGGSSPLHRCDGVIGGKPERAYLLTHRRGLLLQRLCGRRVLFDQRRVLLRDLVHLRQSLVDLIDALGLLGAGAGDVGEAIFRYGYAVDAAPHEDR